MGDKDIYPVWEQYYLKHTTGQAPIRFKFEPGQPVRISIVQNGMDKAHRGTYSEEIYTIHTRIPSNPPGYKLRDSMGRDIQGTFYESELISSPDHPDTEYRVDKIHGKRKGPGGREQVLVSFVGWPPDNQSWVDKASVRT
ncbi:Tetratricopeptide repeat protein 14 [Frankliniella fusca]|nr:Tetratricopeptide repeat protein 14 [Frankliniella fusca]KAK3928708.1 Tetratricopeptide repeat protein 14 [Frankliniella fusca]